MENINPHMSFLELLDVLNEKLIKEDKNELPLIMIVEKVFVVCVHYILMEKPMDQ